MNAPLKNIQLSTVKIPATTAGKQLLQKALWAGCDSCYFLFSILVFNFQQSSHALRNRTWSKSLLDFSRYPNDFLNRFGTSHEDAMMFQAPSRRYLQEREGNNTHQCQRKPGSLPAKNFIGHQDHFSPSLQLLFQACSFSSLHKERRKLL